MQENAWLYWACDLRYMYYPGFDLGPGIGLALTLCAARLQVYSSLFEFLSFIFRVWQC